MALVLDGIHALALEPILACQGAKLAVKRVILVTLHFSIGCQEQLRARSFLLVEIRIIVLVIIANCVENSRRIFHLARHGGRLRDKDPIRVPFNETEPIGRVSRVILLHLLLLTIVKFHALLWRCKFPLIGQLIIRCIINLIPPRLVALHFLAYFIIVKIGWFCIAVILLKSALVDSESLLLTRIYLGRVLKLDELFRVRVEAFGAINALLVILWAKVWVVHEKVCRVQVFDWGLHGVGELRSHFALRLAQARGKSLEYSRWHNIWGLLRIPLIFMRSCKRRVGRLCLFLIHHFYAKLVDIARLSVRFFSYSIPDKIVHARAHLIYVLIDIHIPV